MALRALPSAAMAIETAHKAHCYSQLQKIVSAQSLVSIHRVQGLPQPASLSSLSLKQRRMQTVCMAHPRRVAMVTRQIERDVCWMFTSDPIILSAISPEHAFGCELMTCRAWVSRVELTNNLQCARIYFIVQGDQRGKQIAIGNLKAREKYVRMKVAQSLNLRRAPEVRMIYDDTEEREEMKKKKLALAEGRQRIIDEFLATHQVIKLGKRISLYRAMKQVNVINSKLAEGSSKQVTVNSIERKQEEGQSKDESARKEDIGNTIESKQEGSEEEDSTEYDLSDQTSDTEEDSDESDEQDTTEYELSDQTSDTDEQGSAVARMGDSMTSEETEDQDSTEYDSSEETSDTEEESEEQDSTAVGMSYQTSDTEEDSDESKEQDTTEDDLSDQTSDTEEDSNQSEEQDTTEDDLSDQTSDTEEDSEDRDSTEDQTSDSDSTDSDQSEEDVLHQR